MMVVHAPESFSSSVSEESDCGRDCCYRGIVGFIFHVDIIWQLMWSSDRKLRFESEGSSDGAEVEIGESGCQYICNCQQIEQENGSHVGERRRLLTSEIYLSDRR